MERHEAIVAGAGPAGPAGLAAAAVLRKRGFETVVLERTDAVGARWRSRYDGLRLNMMRTLSSLPELRMGLRAVRYPSRDTFVSYLERYACEAGEGRCALALSAPPGTNARPACRAMRFPGGVCPLRFATRTSEDARECGHD